MSDADILERVFHEVREINRALAYCLKDVTISGCPSPGLLDDALTRLAKLAGEDG